MHYRVEVDGLRAFAVLPVMFFHAGFSWISGGFVGVDVFFVISGFLITSIIFREVSENRFTLVGFYERRARRILPALFITMLLCLPFSWALMNAVQFEAFAKSLVAVTVFLANIFFMMSAFYFAPSSELIPLLHMWSLAVEEQFYVIFPLLLMGLGWLGVRDKRRTAWVLLVIAVLTFIATMLAAKENPNLNFNWPVGRAWELLAGAIAALLYRRPEQVGGIQQAAAWAGLGMLLFGLFWLDPGMSMPSHLSLLPVVGTVLILVAADDRTHVGKLLSFRPFVAIGLISYSAYLFHQPIFAFTRLYLGLDPSLEIKLALLIATLVLARLSWQWIEVPIRNKGGRFYPTRKTLFAGSALGMVLFIGTGLYIIKADGVPSRMTLIAAQAMDIRAKASHFAADCQYHAVALHFNVPQALEDHCFAAPSDDAEAPLAIIIGDSFAGVLADPVLDRLAEQGWRAAKITVAGCPAFPGYRLAGGALRCDQAAQNIYKIIADQKPDLVILANRYNFLFNKSGFDNGAGGREGHGIVSTITDDALGPDYSLAERAAHIVQNGVTDLLDHTQSLMLIYPVPEAGWDVPHLYARQVARGVYSGVIGTSADLFKTRNADAIATLNNIESNRIVKVDPAKILCHLPEHPDLCLNVKDDMVLYADTNHLSETGAALVADQIIAALPE